MSIIDRSIKTLPKVWNQPFPESVSEPLKLESKKRFRRFQLPETKEAWDKLRPQLYKKIADAIRLKVDHSLPLDYEETGTIQMDGYSIKKISYCAAQGRYVTANLYIPDGNGPFPAILNVHGHWQQGKIAARVQMRGHVFAQKGYVCLTVDAFGAGERTTIHGKPEYHGSFLGASLMNAGETLMGIQVADNIRAIDLLTTLPFVDKDKIGVTGASGGGNQTMYVGALDDRIKAVVPVCSVGTYEVYVRSLNCFCELMPGGLDITEESGVLALVAPRALKICCTIGDGECFSVKEMLRSSYEARKVFRALDADAKFSHEAFPGTHGYWPEILESAVGFFDLHLKGIGYGTTTICPNITSLPEEELLVWEPGKAPAKLKSLVAWTNDKVAKLAEERKSITNPNQVKANLINLLVNPKIITINNVTTLLFQDNWQRFTIDADDIMIPVLFRQGQSNTCRIMASSIDKDKLVNSQIYQDAIASSDSILIFDPYGSGEMYAPEFTFGTAPNYHNLSRHCAWLGYYMFGIWVQEYNLLANWAKETFKVENFSFEGTMDAGIAAIFAAAIDNKATNVVAEKFVYSLNLVETRFVSEAASFALVVQDILKYADISTAIALLESKVTLISPLHGDNTPITEDEKNNFVKLIFDDNKKFELANLELEVK